MKYHLIDAAAAVLACGAAGAKDIRIAHVYDKTGLLEAYAKQTQTGLMMGLDYATGGTMTVNGNKLVVIEKDNQGKPDVAKSQLAAAYADDRADIAVGPTSSGAALAMLPVAEEYKKLPLPLPVKWQLPLRLQLPLLVKWQLQLPLHKQRQLHKQLQLQLQRSLRAAKSNGRCAERQGPRNTLWAFAHPATRTAPRPPRCTRR